jgi:hypothetical protein
MIISGPKMKLQEGGGNYKELHSFTFFTKYFQNDHLEDNDTDSACSMHNTLYNI